MISKMRCQKYTCGECEKNFSSIFELLEHKNVHTGQFPFMCVICKELFPTIDDYVRHVVKHNYSIKTPGKIRSFALFGDENEILRNDYSDDDLIEVLNHDCWTSPEFIALKFSSYESLTEIQSRNGDQEKLKSNTKLRSQLNLKNYKTKCKKVNEKNYFCSLCDINFKSVKKFCEHKAEFHNFKCENCNNKYSTREKLGKHVCFVSSNGEPFKCSCLLTFTKSLQFKLHIGDRPYSCCKCLMQFNRITNLIRHIRTHTKQKPYICKQCGRGFSQSANLRNHTSIHLGIKAIKCDECNFSCKTVSGLVKHKKKHKKGSVKHTTYVDKRKASTGAISCPICKKEFPFKRNVGMHIKVHKKKESLCQECGKVFDCKSKLTTHYKACHGEPSICQTCGKTFASSVLLTAHEKIHVSDKKFSCSKCCKMFSIKNYLVQHMKTHSEGKQFSCSKCGKLFKVAVSLKYHNKICSITNNSI